MKILGSCQAITPADATMFESIAQAAKNAYDLLPRNRAWRVDPYVNNGETMCVVKHWPRHKTEICAERRWLKVGETKPKRKKHDEEG